jgi:hypothetical protein
VFGGRGGPVGRRNSRTRNCRQIGKIRPRRYETRKIPHKAGARIAIDSARASVFRYPQLPFVSTMAPKDIKKIPDKLTDSEKKKIKQENKAKANPERAAEKKEKNDAKRETRKVSANNLLETCLATAHLQHSLQASNAGRPLAARDVGCWSKAACTLWHSTTLGSWQPAPATSVWGAHLTHRPSTRPEAPAASRAPSRAPAPLTCSLPNGPTPIGQRLVHVHQ